MSSPASPRRRRGAPADPHGAPPAVPPPPALDAAANPDDFLGYTVVRVGHVLARRFDAMLAAHGLTPRQFGVLAHLARDPGLGSGALARLVLITPQSMGALLDELEAAGLVARTPAARGRRRATALTAAGRRRLLAAAPAVAAFERATTAALTPAEHAAANRALHAVLRTALGAADAAAPTG